MGRVRNAAEHLTRAMRDDSHAVDGRFRNREMNARVIQRRHRPSGGRLLQNRARRNSRLCDARAVDHLEPEREERLGGLSSGLPSDIWDRYLRLPGGESTGRVRHADDLNLGRFCSATVTE